MNSWWHLASLSLVLFMFLCGTSEGQTNRGITYPVEPAFKFEEFFMTPDSSEMYGVAENNYAELLSSMKELYQCLDRNQLFDLHENDLFQLFLRSEPSQNRVMLKAFVSSIQDSIAYKNGLPVRYYETDYLFDTTKLNKEMTAIFERKSLWFNCIHSWPDFIDGMSAAEFFIKLNRSSFKKSLDILEKQATYFSKHPSVVEITLKKKVLLESDECQADKNLTDTVLTVPYKKGQYVVALSKDVRFEVEVSSSPYGGVFNTDVSLQHPCYDGGGYSAVGYCPGSFAVGDHTQIEVSVSMGRHMNRLELDKILNGN